MNFTYRNTLEHIFHHNGMCLEDHGIDFCSTLHLFGREVRLSRLQTIILRHLMVHPEIFFSRDALMDIIQENGANGYVVEERTIDSSIKRLRRKMFPNQAELAHKVIETVYSRGYRLNDIRQQKSKRA